MEDAVRESQVVHALVVKQIMTFDDKQVKEELPEEARHLLKEFEEIMPKELPIRLTYVRDIQHHIDLILC